MLCSKIQETSNGRWKCLIIAVELFSWGRCQCFRCVQMAWKTYWARTVEVFWVWQPFVSLCPLPLQVQQNLHIYGVLLYQRTREKRYPKFLSPFVTVSQALAAWLRLYLTNMYWTLKLSDKCSSLHLWNKSFPLTIMPVCSTIRNPSFCVRVL